MKSKYKHVSSLLLRKTSLRLVMAFLALATPVVLSTSIADAQTSPGVDKYCNKFTVTSEKYACKDGWKGVDCTDYLITHNQSHVDICQNAAREASKSGGTTGSTDEQQTPTTNNSNNTEGMDTVESLIEQIKKSEEKYGNKNGNAKTDKPDNNYGAYINGSGDKQPIRVTKASGKGRPAIIFFNGGGWQTDDKVGDKVAPLAQKRGYSTFVATYRLGSSGIYYQYDDVMRAIRHVRNNAAMYDIDPSKIAIWGDSAGGSLAMRAAGSGKSGARAAVGWSAPTNAYTAIFKSPSSFLIGMDHSTCVPTDVNGIINTIDLLNGGNGDVMENDGTLGNNNFEAFEKGDGLGMVTSVLTLAARAQASGVSTSSMATSIGENGISFGGGGTGTEGQNGEQPAAEGESGGGFGGGDSEAMSNLTAKKFTECVDNFNTASPALFASPLTPPTFLAGYNSDLLVDPGQLYQMRDKLRGMGVPSSVLTLPGLKSNRVVAGENHLDFNEAFVNPSLDFLDRHMGVKENK